MDNNPKVMASDAGGVALPSDRAVASGADAVSALRASVPSALETAIAQATFAHRGQVDKGGQPYILHPLRVMLACKTEEQRVTAMLHDVVEDTDITVDDIRHDFGGAVADAVRALTRCDGEDYAAFIERCAENPIARQVKLADLADNMDLSRLGREPSIADARRHWKYGEARNVLMTAEYAAQAMACKSQE